MRPCCSSAIIKSEKITYFHIKKNPPQCNFKAAKVKDLFPLWGSPGLDGFYTVKVKDFIPADNESHCLVHVLSM